MMFNIVMIEVIRPEGLLGGERWVQLRCHYAGDGSPLLVQMSERAWMEVLEAEPRTHCTLENCGHMRQLNAIVDLLGMPRGGISVLDWFHIRRNRGLFLLGRRVRTKSGVIGPIISVNGKSVEVRNENEDGKYSYWFADREIERVFPEEPPWEDVTDEWTAAIKEAFPTRSESHDEYGIAMQMVSHRHSKGELVALVNWLLVEKAKLIAGHQESERQFQAKCDEIGALLGEVDELTAQRDAFGQKAHQLQERVKELEHVDPGSVGLAGCGHVERPGVCSECVRSTVQGT